MRKVRPSRTCATMCSGRTVNRLIAEAPNSTGVDAIRPARSIHSRGGLPVGVVSLLLVRNSSMVRRKSASTRSSSPTSPDASPCACSTLLNWTANRCGKTHQSLKHLIRNMPGRCPAGCMLTVESCALCTRHYAHTAGGGRKKVQLAFERSHTSLGRVRHETLLVAVAGPIPA